MMMKMKIAIITALLVVVAAATAEPSNNELVKEVVAIKGQLLVLVGRLDRLEQELQTHVS
jgi:hypothetical protein